MTRFEALARTPWIEAVVAAVVGLMFTLLKRTDLAQFTWILGVGLSFSRYAYAQKLESEMAPVKALARLVDLESELALEKFRRIMQLYLKITEPEFRSVKDAILGECAQGLSRLEQKRTSDELSTGDYFNWLFPFLQSAQSGSQIWAVSMMLDIEWEESAAEDTFLELNLEAARRKVGVERIFVVSKAVRPTLLENKYTRAQVEAGDEYLRPLVVEREYLERHDPALLESLGDGLLGIDARVVLVDISSPEGYRGYVTMDSGEIGRLRRMYENVRVNARALTPDGGNLERKRRRGLDWLGAGAARGLGSPTEGSDSKSGAEAGAADARNRDDETKVDALRQELREAQSLLARHGLLPPTLPEPDRTDDGAG